VLLTVPGIGLLTSTAMVAAVGDPRSFDSGRRYASFLGLTPREFSSGEHRYVGRISKRGDRYIRMLLTHGARSILRSATVARRLGRQIDRLKTWALAVQARTNHNKATCALANKLARIAWAVWVKHEKYRGEAAPVPPSA
jgi:transposase